MRNESDYIISSGHETKNRESNKIIAQGKTNKIIAKSYQNNIPTYTSSKAHLQSQKLILQNFPLCLFFPCNFFKWKRRWKKKQQRDPSIEGEVQCHQEIRVLDEGWTLDGKC